jgi:ribosomal protein L37E
VCVACINLHRATLTKVKRVATTTCAKCGGHAFEAVPLTPLGQSYRVGVLQCAGCGTGLGVIGDPNVLTQIEALKTQIAAMHDRLTRIASALARLSD